VACAITGRPPPAARTLLRGVRLRAVLGGRRLGRARAPRRVLALLVRRRGRARGLGLGGLHQLLRLSLDLGGGAGEGGKRGGDGREEGQSEGEAVAPTHLLGTGRQRQGRAGRAPCRRARSPRAPAAPGLLRRGLELLRQPRHVGLERRSLGLRGVRRKLRRVGVVAQRRDLRGRLLELRARRRGQGGGNGWARNRRPRQARMAVARGQYSCASASHPAHPRPPCPWPSAAPPPRRAACWRPPAEGPKQRAHNRGSDSGRAELTKARRVRSPRGRPPTRPLPPPTCASASSSSRCLSSWSLSSPAAAAAPARFASTSAAAALDSASRAASAARRADVRSEARRSASSRQWSTWREGGGWAEDGSAGLGRWPAGCRTRSRCGPTDLGAQLLGGCLHLLQPRLGLHELLGGALLHDNRVAGQAK
jgi:hypothetical protein